MILRAAGASLVVWMLHCWWSGCSAGGGLCLIATSDKWDNGESISSIDTGHASIEHGAKTDSDLARPPGGDHPATQQAQASPGVLTQSAARRGRSAASHAHSSPIESE